MPMLYRMDNGLLPALIFMLGLGGGVVVGCGGSEKKTSHPAAEVDDTAQDDGAPSNAPGSGISSSDIEGRVAVEHH